MLLFKDIHYDARVQREAEALAESGHMVKIACLKEYEHDPPRLHNHVDVKRMTISTKRFKRKMMQTEGVGSEQTNPTIGMTLIESMACGCPTVAPAVGAIPEVMDEELSIYLYHTKDEEQAIQRIKVFLDDHDKRSEIISRGREKVEQSYTIERVGGQYLSMLKQLLSDR